MGNVHNYIYCFHELKNDIPLMNLVEAYSLFMHDLNPQLCLLAGTLVDSGNMNWVIKVVKHELVYGKDKVVLVPTKMKIKIKRDDEVSKGIPREAKGRRDPVSNGPKG